MIYHYVNKMNVPKFLVTKETKEGVEVYLFNEDNGEFLGANVVIKEQLQKFLSHYTITKKEGD